MNRKKASFYQRLCLLGTQLMTLCRGRRVGVDEFGNTYYEERRPAAGRHARRWVIYRGPRDATTVPPAWHGWLHYTFATPDATEKFQQPWQLPHQPNATATTAAYRPNGSQLAGGRRAAATGDYEAWKPNS